MRRWTLLSVLILLVVSGNALHWGSAEAKDKPDLQTGATIYKKYCARCHGAQGRGDGPATRILKTKPPDFTNRAYMAKKTDEELLTVIANGGAAVGKSKLMPPYRKKLNERELRAVVAYIRSLTGS